MDQNSEKQLNDIEKGERLKYIFEILTKDKKKYERTKNTRSLTSIEQKEYDNICAKLCSFYEKCRIFIKPRKNGPGKFMVQAYVNWCANQKKDEKKIFARDNQSVNTSQSMYRTTDNPVINVIGYDQPNLIMKNTEVKSQTEPFAHYSYSNNLNSASLSEKYNRIQGSLQPIDSIGTSFDIINGRVPIHSAFQKQLSANTNIYTGLGSPQIKSNIGAFPSSKDSVFRTIQNQAQGRYEYSKIPISQYGEKSINQTNIREDEHVQRKMNPFEGRIMKYPVENQSTARIERLMSLDDIQPLGTNSFEQPAHMTAQAAYRGSPLSQSIIKPGSSPSEQQEPESYEYTKLPTDTNFGYYSNEYSTFLSTKHINGTFMKARSPVVPCTLRCDTVEHSQANTIQRAQRKQERAQSQILGEFDFCTRRAAENTIKSTKDTTDSAITISARRRTTVPENKEAIAIQSTGFSFEFNCEQKKAPYLDKAIKRQPGLFDTLTTFEQLKRANDDAFSLTRLYHIPKSFHKQFTPKYELSKGHIQDLNAFSASHSLKKCVPNALFIPMFIHLDTVFHKVLLASCMLAQAKKVPRLNVKDIQEAVERHILKNTRKKDNLDDHFRETLTKVKEDNSKGDEDDTR
ncbi:hypothetical protein GINT2_000040 [Glugoides intestinalis]